MEYLAKRIHSSNAITMRTSTIPTIRLTERIAIITQTNVIRITQPTAVADHKTTINKFKAADGFPSAAAFISVLIFFNKLIIAF